MNNIIKNPIKRFFLKELVRISSTVNTPVVGQSVDDILSNLNSVYVLLYVCMCSNIIVYQKDVRSKLFMKYIPK